MDPPHAATDEDPEHSAIRAVIREETAAWLRRDFAAWSDCWVRDERAQHVNARPSVGARRLVGFGAISDYFAKAMASLAPTSVVPEDVRYEDWRISVGGNMAWATYDQLVPLGSDPDAAPGRHNQLRILERHQGQWKIAGVFHVPNRIGYYRCPWVRVQANGKVIETGPGAAETFAGEAVGPGLLPLTRAGDDAADGGADRKARGERGDDHAAFSLVSKLADARGGTFKVACFFIVLFVGVGCLFVGERVFEGMIVFFTQRIDRLRFLLIR